MNKIFFFIVGIAFCTAGVRQVMWVPQNGTICPMEALSKAMIESAGGSVELALGLIGVMTLFLGLMKIAEEGGILHIISKLIRPLMVRLFPDVPPEHPAMGAMVLNMSANALGLGNAATPFGIKAMQELDHLNRRPGTATDAMVLFLAINTSNVTLLPTGVIALRAAAGSSDPAGILPTTLIATTCSTVIAIFAAKFYRRFSTYSAGNSFSENIDQEGASSDGDTMNEASAAYPFWVSGIAFLCLLAFIPLTIFFGKSISPWIVPLLMIGFLTFGIIRRVRIYEVFVEGANEE